MNAGDGIGRRAAKLVGVLAMLTACTAARTGRSATAPAARTCAGSFSVRGAQDLRRMAGCTRIEGDVRIAATDLTSLEGLGALQHVEGRLEITGNARLQSLSGLDNLRNVRTLVVADDPALRSVAAVGRLELLGSGTFANLPRLGSLRGLEHVHFASRLAVTRTGIRDLAPLGALHAVGDLVIGDNPELASLQGLDRLEGARAVVIENNPRLADVRALDAMQWLSTPPVVRGNDVLPDRDATRLRARGMLAAR